jgi:hypothetical protein
MKKITSCKIGPYPRPMPEGMFDPMPSVNVTYDDGTTQHLFDFYPDELSFSERDFIGLTEAEALALRHKKDVAYLQS